MYTNGSFTPPGLQGTMVTFPSTLGSGNWNGLSYDPTVGLVFSKLHVTWANQGICVETSTVCLVKQCVHWITARRTFWLVLTSCT